MRERCDLNNPKNKLIILILSGKNNISRRKVQQETWLKNIHIPYHFVLGGEEISQEPNVLWVDADDSELAQKLLRAYKYLLKYDFDHIFTCDDDTYVVVERLLACGYEDHMYMGTRWEDHAEGGAGFFLNRESIERFAQVPIDHPSLIGPSDVAIGNLAKMYTVYLHEDNRFIQGYSSKKKHGELPTPSNDVITSHYITLQLFKKIHSQFSHLYWKKILAQDPKFQLAKAIL